eukprot:6045400-Amphidinium_carterae.1
MRIALRYNIRSASMSRNLTLIIHHNSTFFSYCKLLGGFGCLHQVEILDRHIVSRAERAKADEIIPNLDKVAGAKPERCQQLLMDLRSPDR